MSNAADFIVRLIDKVTRPARVVSKAIGGIDKQLKKLRKSDAFGALEAASERAVGWLKGTAAVIGTIGVGVGALVTAMTFKMGMFAERSRQAFTSLTGSAGLGDAAFKRSMALADELGQSVVDTTQNMIKLRAAQFSVGQAETLVKLGADMRALGSDAEQVKSAMRAITQIKAKGRLQSEELVGQLAEANVATTMVYDALSKQLGKTQEQVRKLITAGKVTADQGIEAIQAAIMKKANVTVAGAAGKRFAQSLSGIFERLKAAPEKFFLRVAELGKTSLGRVRSTLIDVLNKVNALDASKFAAFFERVVALLPVAIDLVSQFADGFGQEFGAILAGMAAVTGAAGTQKELWFNMGKSVAQGFGLALSALQKISEFIAFLQTPTGKWVAGIGAVLLLLPPLVSLVSALVTSFGAMVTVSELAVLGLAKVLPVIGTALGALVGAVGAVPLAIGAALIGVGLAIYHWWDDIVAFFWRGVAFFEDIGSRLVDGFMNGFKSSWSRNHNVLLGLFDGVVGSIKGLLGIASPSKVMMKVGSQTGEGYLLGLQQQLANGSVGLDELGGAFDRGAAGGLSEAPAPAVVSRAGGSPLEVVIRTINVYVGEKARTREVVGAVKQGVREALDSTAAFAGA